MTEARLAPLAVVGLSVLTALADILVKIAAEIGRVGSFHPAGAAAIFALDGVYFLATILLLVLAGIVLFGERPALPDMFVLAMPLVALPAFWRHP